MWEYKVMRRPTELLEVLFKELSMIRLFHTKTFSSLPPEVVRPMENFVNFS